MNIPRCGGIGTALLSGVLLLSACASSTGASRDGSATANTSANLACATKPVPSAGSGGSGGSSTSTSPQPVAIATPSGSVDLTEDGSTLIYPYLEALVSPFHAAYPKLTLSPGPGGSGKGISDASAGNVLMGGSDAYLSSSQMAAHPDLLNIPIAISAQAVDYNLPGLKLPEGQSGLKLSGCILANMYEGHITSWNDPSIAALNPGAKLPIAPVVPIHRVDSSGDTFIFTSLLSDTNGEWASGPSFGTTVTWPAASQLTGNGNPDMVNKCAANPGCVAYIGVSVEQSALTDGLGEALLQNQSGNFVLPTPANMQAAVTAGAGNVPSNLAAPLIYEPGQDSYPIVNFEYLMVSRTQKSADDAIAIKDFFAWALSTSGGATGANLATVGFIALPANVLPKVVAAVNSISG
jgi:phosphate transport system substrate-binding protein